MKKLMFRLMAFVLTLACVLTVLADGGQEAETVTVPGQDDSSVNGAIVAGETEDAAAEGAAPMVNPETEDAAAEGAAPMVNPETEDDGTEFAAEAPAGEAEAVTETAEQPRVMTAYASISSDYRNESVEEGTEITLTADISAFEGLEYSIVWQYSPDNGTTVVDAQVGGNTLTFTANAETVGYLWRVVVTYTEA